MQKTGTTTNVSATVTITEKYKKNRRKLAKNNVSTIVQFVSWYDNENSYTSQMVRTIKYFAEL